MKVPWEGKKSESNSDLDYREWLLMHAQMQLDFADVDKAVTLLELVEAAYGADMTTSFMLCRAWVASGALVKLENKAKNLLLNEKLTSEQRAVIYYCLSVARWKADDRAGARQARESYSAFMKARSLDSAEN